MTLENPLMLGIILIVVGISTALIATAILLNRRDKEKEKVNIPEPEPALGHEEPQPHTAQRAASSTPEDFPDVTPPSSAPANPNLPPAPAQNMETGQPLPPGPTQAAETGQAPLPAPAQAIETDQSPVPGEDQAALHQIAAIKLDPDSGRPVLSIGGQDYTSAAQLRSSSDWYVVKNSLGEIASWVKEDPPEPRRTSIFGVPRPPAVESKPLNQKPALPPVVSMVEQINDIIQEKIKLTGQAHLSVRLIENLQGEVKALVGVESYPLDEIPDPGVQAFIRECVSEWESKI